MSRRYKLYVGSDRWGREEWVGSIYPLDAVSKNYMMHYHDVLNFVESRTSYYKEATADGLEKYVKFLGKRDFKMCPFILKQQVVKMYEDPNLAAQIFEKNNSLFKTLEQHFGAFVLDTRPIMQKLNKDQLKSLISKLPHNYSVVILLQKSHHTFVDDEFINYLNQQQVALVINDPSLHPFVNKFKSPFCYFNIDINVTNIESFPYFDNLISDECTEVYSCIAGSPKQQKQVGETLIKIKQKYK